MASATGTGNRSEKARRVDTLIENIPGVVVDFMSLQKPDVLVTERYNRMMIHLTRNVLNDSILTGRTDRKCAVSVLPAKFPEKPASLINMFARICL